MRAERRLAGEHDGVGAVEDRVRDVVRFGARRARAVDHRLEHLGRGDHGLRRAVRARDQVLLDQRDLFERDLDAEIAARDHDPVGDRDDLVDALERFVLLDLRDDGDVLAVLGDEILDADDVVGGAHERDRDPIDAGLDAEREMLEIAVGHRRDVRACRPGS